MALSLMFAISNPCWSITDDDFKNAERSIELVMRACLSSNKLKIKVKGKVDLSFLKKALLEGGVGAGGEGEYEKEDIVGYLPDLKDELQQAEKDAIRKCVNPMMREIFEQNGLVKKK